MRRAQTVRHYGRPSLALGTDDLGMLKESPDESSEDVLRRQLIEKDRECDKLQAQIQTLQAQLAQRPPLEAVQALQKEYTNLDILLQGTQRENERCMAELERGKAREKMLERELEKLAGANWQANLNISAAPAPVAAMRAANVLNPHRLDAGSAPGGGSAASTEATAAHVEQVRLLILGMEQRLQSREEKLLKTIERAETEGDRFEERRKQVLSAVA
ncbi:hypothetical protein POSPLADRAFT_1042138 [Postia placenta MAD-698-R-SB12]|uniref:Uncharacterized protein n=1 Tax=Postia placenta MAD-698-R-SB12 TaxID=670580 RepID=A0A1X6NDV1_9APHY|nr:hypothetical protein POSPLADRAFT_1042138 [Postia placenta MAD-698-R-SB12]OSX66829.1 hypothetical protein POSPLADRAFT_1042138 [Postia placenta MAD-698-R-SB12]